MGDSTFSRFLVCSRPASVGTRRTLRWRTMKMFSSHHAHYLTLSFSGTLVSSFNGSQRLKSRVSVVFVGGDNHVFWIFFSPDSDPRSYCVELIVKRQSHGPSALATSSCENQERKTRVGAN